MPVLGRAENHGIRLVSGSGLETFLSTVLTHFLLRLGRGRGLVCFFEPMR